MLGFEVGFLMEEVGREGSMIGSRVKGMFLGYHRLDELSHVPMQSK